MKRIIKSYGFLLVGFLSLFLFSCEDDNVLTVEPQSNAIALALDISEIQLDGTNPSNPGLTLTWTEAVYTQPVEINYIVEFDIDQNFSNPVVVGTVVSTNYATWSVGELNSAVSQAGVNPFDWTTVYARIKSNIGTQSGLENISNVVSFDVYAYFNYDFLDLFMVGPASAPGWNNNSNNPPLFRDPDNAKLFTYTGYFNADALKLLEVRGQWAPQYGKESAGKLAARPTEDVSDPSPIDDIKTSGYYTFEVNMANLEYSLTPYSATSSAATSVSISGSALAADASLAQLTSNSAVFDAHIWNITSVHLVPGEMTFVLNGSNNWGSTTSFSGTSTLNGGSIPVVVEDDYEVWFNDLTGEYHMIPINLSK